MPDTVMPFLTLMNLAAVFSSVNVEMLSTADDYRTHTDTRLP